MRRILLLVLVLTLAVGSLAARRNEQLCFRTTAGVEVEACDVAGTAYSLELEAFEPTMGADPAGNLFYAITPGQGVALGWEASVGASFDGGATWQDIRPNTAGVNTPPETNDPYTYVDPGTGRVFAFHMGPILLCSILSWTDNQGESWDTTPIGCAPTGPWDHQTMVAARPVDGVQTIGYPNVLVQCVNAIYAAECGRSLDGGRTWQHTVPVHVNTGAVDTGSTCGAQHGHLAADEAGNIYLPTSKCGTGAYIFVSRDSGLTWSQLDLFVGNLPFEDPAVAVDAEGVIHAVWADWSGGMQYVHSVDDGATWSKAIRVTPKGVTGKLPTIVSGDGGKIAFAFVGTDDYPSTGYEYTDDDAFDEDFYPEDLEWGGWITYSQDANTDTPTFTTIEATGLDPIMRGEVCDFSNRCDAQLDFIGSTLTPDGRVFAAVIDACFEECTVEDGNDKDGTGVAAVITIDGLDLCQATCPRFPVGSGEAIDAGASFELPKLPTAPLLQAPVEPFPPMSPAVAELRRAYNQAREEHLAGR